MASEIGERIGRSVQQSHPEIINFVGLSGIAILDVFSYPNPLVFGCFVCISASSIFFSSRRNRRLKSRVDRTNALENVIREGHRNFFDVWDDKARELFQAIPLGIKDRISIYKFDENLKQFRLLGRYAEFADYRERSREVYPPDQGVIGKAWLEGECFEKKLPNADQNMTKYCEANERKYGMPREVTEALKMKSTCLYAFTLRNEKNIPFAIVVVESTKRESLDKETVEASFADGRATDISNLMRSLEFMEPSLRQAAELHV